MIELTAVACLLANPSVCKDVSLNISDSVTPQQCLLMSQGEAKKWLDDHPGWRVARLSCGRVGRYAKA